MKNSRGFLLYAFGSKDLDYGKLAICCALSIKSNLKNNSTTVIMDLETKENLIKRVSKSILDAAFDNIIIPDIEFRGNIRKHIDSPWSTFNAEFNNSPRIFSYKYSPYVETIIIDSDYIIMNNDLDSIWNNKKDLLINKKAIDLQGNIFGDIRDQKLSKYGIPMFWATLVYFKKSIYAETYFNLIDYIKKEYNYFQFLYGFKGNYYRNDFSFSIAIHILNGYINEDNISFPDDTILTSYQQDAIAKFKNSNEIIFLSNNIKEPWKDVLVNIKNRSVHIMNKKELLKISDDYINSCLEKL